MRVSCQTDAKPQSQMALQRRKLRVGFGLLWFWYTMTPSSELSLVGAPRVLADLERGVHCQLFP